MPRGWLFGSNSLIECLNEGNRCRSLANRDQQQACDDFARELENAYERALALHKTNDLFKETVERVKAGHMKPAGTL